MAVRGRYGTLGRYHRAAPRSIQIPVPSTIFLDRNERFLERNVHGGLGVLATAQPLDAVPTDLVVTPGTGRLLVIINAGTDLAGTITVTGTVVNRETGAEGADTDTLVIDALTTDGSDADGDGNVRHSFTGAYITDKWFKGATTLSTTDLTLTDVDVWQCSFEQMNDWPEFELDTFDLTTYVTNTNGWLYAYLYSIVMTTGDKADVTRESSLDLPAAEVTANRWYRLRRGDIGTVVNGSTDGFFVDLHLGPNNQQYWEDLTMKVWSLVKIEM